MFKFLNFFDSKGKKLVKQWVKEHNELKELSHRIVMEYTRGNQVKCKSYLSQFVNKVLNHVQHEDIELEKFLDGTYTVDEDTKKGIKHFHDTFADTKTALVRFLAKHNQPEVKLDLEFFDTFLEMSKVLVERIKFEEDALYFRLNLS